MEKGIVSDLLLKQKQKKEEKKEKEKNKFNKEDIDFAFTVFMTKGGEVIFLPEINIEGRVFNMADVTALKVYHILSEATYVATLQRFMFDFTQFGGGIMQQKSKKGKKDG